MRVSLARRRYEDPAAQTAAAAVPLCDPRGPKVVLGAESGADGLAAPIVPSRASLFGPRGAVVDPVTGALAVADTGHHRLLIWRDTPHADRQPADVLIGQRDFSGEGRNGKRPVAASSLNVPTGIATDGRALAVADAWNHRVLIWHRWPERDNQPADVVLGQAASDGCLANRGGPPGAATLNWCYGVAFLPGGLAVADTGNRRVLLWHGLPEHDGQPADIVLGQQDFACRDENGGVEPGAGGMRWPHAVAGDGKRLFVADAGDNRIMIWNTSSPVSGAPCDAVLGQKSFAEVEHNRGRYWPEARALNMPYGIAVSAGRLVVADTANSRLLGWRMDEASMDAPAFGLAGQPDFSAKGDNRWQAPARDSLCWPYGVTAAGGTLAIADSGNNRVLIWDLAS